MAGEEEIIVMRDKKGTLRAFNEADRVDPNALLEMPCDILAPCAIDRVIHEKNADKIKCRILAEGANTTVRIGQSTITGNFRSWDNTVGFAKVQSFGDNYIAGNGDGDPAPPVIARK